MSKLLESKSGWGNRIYIYRPRSVSSWHVERVCLLSKLHEAKHHVNVKLDMDEMDLTAVESEATYEEIKKYVA